jgi:hypothetical protein
MIGIMSFCFIANFGRWWSFQPDSLTATSSAFSACTSSLFLMTFAAVCLASRILGAIAAPFVVQGKGDFAFSCLIFGTDQSLVSSLV